MLFRSRDSILSAILKLPRLKTDLVSLFDAFDFSGLFWGILFRDMIIPLERDDFYSVTDYPLNGRRRVYPKLQSVAVRIVVNGLEEISENLTRKTLISIWTKARSTLFLEWFTELTKSADRTVCRETGWTLLIEIIKAQYYYSWSSLWDKELINATDYVRLQKAKIKLLIGMGGSAHYNAHKASILRCEGSLLADLILTPYGFAIFTEILQEFEISLEHYVKQELKKGSLSQFGWSKEALMDAFLRIDYFRQHVNYYMRRNRCHRCNISDGCTPISWLDYLKALKMRRDPNDLYPSHEPVTHDNEKLIHNEEKHDDSDQHTQNCLEDSFNLRENHNVTKDNESYHSEDVKTNEEFSDADEEFYKESQESAEQSETWYCFKCAKEVFYGSDIESAEQDSAKSKNFSMPGSFE